MQVHRPADRGRHSTGRSTWLGLVVLSSVALISLCWLVHPYFHASNDASIYIQSARSILRGHGYSYMGIPVILRPPAFPLLIAPVLEMFGSNFWALNLYISLWGVACVALYYLFARARLGVPLALALAVCVWFNPAFMQLRQRVMSDVPGAAWLFGCLLLDRWSRDRRSPVAELLLGLSIGAGCYVRSALAFLVPAIVLSRVIEWWTHRDGRTALAGFVRQRLLIVAIVPVLVLLPWVVRDRLVDVPVPAESVKVHSYWVAMWHVDTGNPASPRVGWNQVKNRIAARLDGVRDSLGNRMVDRVPRAETTGVAVLAIVCWLVVLVRRREPPELFFGFFLFILLIYFSFVKRLVLPLYLLAFVNVAEVAVDLLRRVVTVGAARGAVVVAVLALAVADLQLGVPDDVVVSYERQREVARLLDAVVPPDRRIGAGIGHHLSAIMDRPVFTLLYAHARGGDERVREIVRENQIAAIVLREPPKDRALAELVASLSSRQETLPGYTVHFIEEAVPASLPTSPGSGSAGERRVEAAEDRRHDDAQRDRERHLLQAP